MQVRTLALPVIAELGDSKFPAQKHLHHTPQVDGKCLSNARTNVDTEEKFVFPQGVCETSKIQLLCFYPESP